MVDLIKILRAKFGKPKTITKRKTNVVRSMLLNPFPEYKIHSDITEIITPKGITLEAHEDITKYY